MLFGRVVSQGSDSSIGFLGRPRWTPYCFAPVTRMMRFNFLEAPVCTRALRKLSSMAPEVMSNQSLFYRMGKTQGHDEPFTSQFSCSVSFCKYAAKKRYSPCTVLRSLAISSAVEVRSI